MRKMTLAIMLAVATAFTATPSAGQPTAGPAPSTAAVTSQVVSTEVGGLTVPAAAAPAVKVGNTLLASCVIRFDHADRKTPTMLGGSHACVGVRRVFINPEGDLELRLTVTDTARWKVTKPDVSPDEQLAGVVATGGSGGTGSIRVWFWDRNGRHLDLTKQADRDVIWGRNRNIWYSSEWIDATTFTNGGQ